MGFSGGGSNVLKNHRHDATVVQDGGSLDADNVTSADLTAGDVIFSDGTHLQRLAIGTPAQQIQVNAGATAPEWYTAAASASTWVKLYDSGQLGAAGSIDSGVFAGYDFLTVFFSGNINTAWGGAGIKFNNTATSSGLYYQTNTQTVTTDTTYAKSAGGGILWDYVGAGGSTDWQSAHIIISNNATNRKTATWTTVQTKGGAVPYRNFGAGWYNNSLTQITRVEMCDGDSGATGATREFGIGSQMIVLGLT